MNEEKKEPSLKASKQCAKWLSDCITNGWDKSQLNELESLWWQHHDKRSGKLIPSSGKAIHPIAEAEHIKPDNSRNWTEDFSHENGNYQNICKECGCLFMGHKRRVTCKSCVQPDLKLNFSSKHEYIQSFRNLFGFDDEECETFLWFLAMWDSKKQLQYPAKIQLAKVEHPSEKELDEYDKYDLAIDLCNYDDPDEVVKILKGCKIFKQG